MTNVSESKPIGMRHSTPQYWQNQLKLATQSHGSRFLREEMNVSPKDPKIAGLPVTIQVSLGKD
jgi:hypothetical protein